MKQRNGENERNQRSQRSRERLGDRQRDRREGEVVFRPAVSPIEAAVLPARQARPLGALHHAKASFDLDAREKRADGYRLRLRGWGPHRQKI